MAGERINLINLIPVSKENLIFKKQRKLIGRLRETMGGKFMYYQGTYIKYFVLKKAKGKHGN